jgi:hypothetical protein
MLIQLIIELLVLLLGIYYLTVFLHFMGFSLFVKKPTAESEKAKKSKKTEETEVDDTKKFEVSLGLALIPFFYWFKRDTTV